MNELTLTVKDNNDIITTGFRLHKTGLEAVGDPTFEQWENCGRFIRQAEGAVHFWIGDWLNYGETKWGEMYAQAIDQTGYDYQTLANDKWLADSIQLSDRSENLGVRHAQLIAPLSEEDKKYWAEEIRKEPVTVKELKERIRERKNSLLPPPPLPEGKYRVIYADPPWKYDVDLSSGATRSPENNYPVMDLPELVEFGAKVRELTADNCVLFMWITAPKLNWMMDILNAWGFDYKTNLIWDKMKPNMGHYSSVRHEILVIAVKGNFAPLCDGKTIQTIDSVQQIEKSPRHSEKPEDFRLIIETLYPDTKRIELFGRHKVAGWEVWGNDAALT